MYDNKTKLIILGIAILLLSAILFLIFSGKGVNTEDDAASKLFQELKNNHPEFSDSQLEFYRETAKKDKGIIVPCAGRNDADNCISSVAYLKSKSGICGEIKDSGVRIKCVDEILQRSAIENIDKCQLLNDYLFINCLTSVFAVYDKKEYCLNLNIGVAQQTCENVFNYKVALSSGEEVLCTKITDDKLKQYCAKNIAAADKLLDSDNDELTNYEEKFVYKTDPNNPDTDGDGYSDSIEIKNGHNPLGE